MLPEEDDRPEWEYRGFKSQDEFDEKFVREHEEYEANNFMEGLKKMEEQDREMDKKRQELIKKFGEDVFWYETLTSPDV